MCISINILHLCMLCIQVFVHKMFTGKTRRVLPPPSQLSNPNWLQFSGVENVAAAQKCNKAREDLSRIPRALPPNPTVWECHPRRRVGLNRWRWTNFRAEAKLRRLLTVGFWQGADFFAHLPISQNPTWLKDSPRTGTMFICPINASRRWTRGTRVLLHQRHLDSNLPPSPDLKGGAFDANQQQEVITQRSLWHTQMRKEGHMVHPRGLPRGKEHPEFRKHS